MGASEASVLSTLIRRDSGGRRASNVVRGLSEVWVAGLERVRENAKIVHQNIRILPWRNGLMAQHLTEGRVQGRVRSTRIPEN